MTKESKLGRYGKQKGFYAHLGMKIGSLLRAGASYQNLMGKNWDDMKQITWNQRIKVFGCSAPH